MKKEIIEELKTYLPLLPLTIYNLKEMPVHSKSFGKIKTKESQTYFTAYEIVKHFHKSVSKIL
jgi:hypothetical protein